MPGVLDPYKSLFLNAPPKYPNCIDVAPSDVIWKTIDNRLGYLTWPYQGWSHVSSLDNTNHPEGTPRILLRLDPGSFLRPT
ncbi:unnamed protein product [Rangifer tarandus platyrhynchus]|uniref:Uncharacterized protein n=1 Tax=Rangifer tarandus platyrhynchus TaxID=3082113 RepID=A0AC59ZNY9_RANTA